MLSVLIRRILASEAIRFGSWATSTEARAMCTPGSVKRVTTKRPSCPFFRTRKSPTLKPYASPTSQEAPPAFEDAGNDILQHAAGSGDALDLREEANRIADPFEEHARAWRGFVDLYRRPYWTRTWIEQELLLAQSVIISWGTRVSSGETSQQ